MLQRFVFPPVIASLRHPLIRWLLLLAIGFGLTLGIAACNVSQTKDAAHSASPTLLRMGYQKSSTLLNLLRNQGNLEQRLRSAGVTVQWNEFTAGPQMLEALNVGSIDFANTGETPPVFAQAAGAPLRYVAYQPLGGAAEAILVRKDSPLKRVADLKGRKVVLNKGSNVHYFLVKALAEAGLQYGDIQAVFLPPGEARPAFEQGNVDAWAIWDPFYASAEKAIGARVLRDGKGLVENRGFFLSTQRFVQEQPERINIILAELRKVSEWASRNPQAVTQFMAKELNIEQSALERAEQRIQYGVKALDAKTISDQQQIADTLQQLNLIPHSIQVSQAIWQANQSRGRT